MTAAGVDAGALRWPLVAFGLIAAMTMVLGVGALAGGRAARRRGDGAWWWRVLGAPIDAERARSMFAGALWVLIRGGGQAARPDRPLIGRRYADVLSENLGQPGFRELMLIVSDLVRIEIRAHRGRRDQSSGSGEGEPAADFSPKVSGTAFVGMPKTTVLPDDPSS